MVLAANGDRGDKGQYRIVVVEDALVYQTMIRTVLESDGYMVSLASTGHEGLALVKRHDPELVILDLGLPDSDGMDICRQIRSASDAYVLMLTGRKDDESKFAGLRIGADAYVTKPFESRELLVPVEVLLRRVKPKAAGAIDLGWLQVDVSTRRMVSDGADVQLTKIETTLLACLIENADQVVTRAQLMEAIWGEHWSGDDHVISVHIANLRKKFPPQVRDCLATVRGVGYQLASVSNFSQPVK